MKKFILIFVSFILIAQWNSAQNKGHSTQPQMKFVPTDPNVTIKFKTDVVNYGKIAHYSNGAKAFYFTNAGTKPLLITNVEGTCGCTVPVWPKYPIKPGATDKITVKYATDRVGVFEKSVNVFSNATNSKVKLTIKGEVSAYPKTLPVGVKPFDNTK
jgi:Protein of unknown function (DUF1573)